MKLKTIPPAGVQALLQAAGVKREELVLSLASDINLLGQFRPQWVMATKLGVWVVDEAHARDLPPLRVNFTEAQEFRTIAVVGSGLLQAKVDGVWLDVARYSNSLQYHFNRAAKRMDQLRQGQSFELTEEDEFDPCRCRTCGLMLSFPAETCPRCISRGKALQRVATLMRPYWKQASVMMALLLLGVGLNLVEPLLTKYLIDNVLQLGGPHARGEVPRLHTPAEAMTVLLLLVGLVAAFQIGRVVISILNGRLGSRVATSITFDMRARLVEHLQKLSLSYYDKQQIGSLVGRVAYDTEGVQGFVSQFTGGFLQQIIMVVCSAAMMFSLSPKLAMWTLLPAPLVLSGTLIFYRFVYPHYLRFWERSSRQAGMLNGLLSGIRVVKAFAQEDRELDRFQNSSAQLRDARRKVDMSSATFYPLMFMVFQMGGWIVWYVGGHEVLNKNAGGEGITMGTLMAFFGLMWMFYHPLNALTNLTNWVTQFSTQMHRIFEVLDTPTGIPDAKQPLRIKSLRGDIRFSEVTFGYTRQNPILKKISFEIKSGQTIGIVGRSGSGKTTIINLLNRFYDIDEGEIFLDDAEIRKIDKNDLRRQIGVVLQEPFLFRGTLWENMIYGRTDATVEEVIAAAKAGNAHDFIMRQNLAYDTWVGERGAGISGGERQRLSLARALLCDPRLLILDEATSSVDSESELAIQKALAELVKGRTSIIIAHRLSTLRNCDRIFVIDEGRLIESGSHVELMRLGGKYAHLVRLQSASSNDNSVDDLNAQEKQRQLDREAIESVTVSQTTGLAVVGSHRPRWLTPAIAQIHLGNRNALHVTVLDERIYSGVYALRCMPVRHPEMYISLRYVNAENHEQELGLIHDLAEWPDAARQLVRDALQRRYFALTITGVESIRNFADYLSLQVQTDQGPRAFIMRWGHSTALDYGSRGKVLLDCEDNRYVIPDVTALPAQDRARLERYIYW